MEEKENTNSLKAGAKVMNMMDGEEGERVIDKLVEAELEKRCCGKS